MESASVNARHQHRHEGGEYRRIELITGASRRRRWSAAEKAAMVAESLRPGVNVSELARLRGVNRGLLLTWRRAALRAAADGAFVPIRVEEAPAGSFSFRARRDDAMWTAQSAYAACRMVSTAVARRR